MADKVMSEITKHLKEGEFLTQVVELAELTGWLVYHARPAWSEKGWRTPIQGNVGFPDLVLVRAPQMIFAELKSQKGKAAETQLTWLSQLNLVARGLNPHNIFVYIWRPDDWDQIVNILCKAVK
jgi:hypothetical protein